MDLRIKFLYIAILKDKQYLRTNPYGWASTPLTIYFEYEHPHNGDYHWMDLFDLASPPEDWYQHHQEKRYVPGGWKRRTI